MNHELAWTRRCRLLIVLVWLSIWLVRLSGADDICDDNKQERQATYVLDLLKNGHWILQENHFHELAGKPPLYTWLCALSAEVLCGGELNRFSLTFPGSVAVLLTAMILFEWGRSRFKWQTGLFAGLFWLLTPVAAKLAMLGRIDAVFTFCIFAAIFAGLEAHRGRCSWVWFWTAATAANFAKGPLGLLLAALPVAYVGWRRRGEARRPGSTRQNLIGATLFLALGLAWFFAAWNCWGQPFIDRLIHGELIGQVISADETKPLSEKIAFFFGPAGYLLGRSLPWCLLLLPAAWLLWRRKALADTPDRQELQSLWIYAGCGLLIFCAASHHRPDLIFPLVPSVCMIASWSLVSLLERRWQTRHQIGFALAVSTVIITGLAARQTATESRRPEIARTAGIKELHRGLAELYPAGRPRLEQTLGTVFGLQLLDQTHRQHISCEEAANLLKKPEATLIAVQQLDAGPLALALTLRRADGSSIQGLEIRAEDLAPGTLLSVDIPRLNHVFPGPLERYDNFGFPAEPQAYSYHWQGSVDGRSWTSLGREEQLALTPASSGLRIRLRLSYRDPSGESLVATQLIPDAQGKRKFAAACAALGVEPELILSWPESCRGNKLASENYIHVFGNAAAKARLVPQGH
ncbi:MAG: hypothetical protein RL095_1343 [Verrucomicrobiota bacterium]|jgi:4-amino-4-deoxy-L-arabinose transferase-like glycosyltransferase